LSGGGPIDFGELSDEERKAVMTLPGAYQGLKGSSSGKAISNGPGNKKGKKIASLNYEDYTE